MTTMAIEKKEMDGQVVLAVETEEDFREALRISEKTGEVIAASEALARADGVVDRPRRWRRDPGGHLGSGRGGQRLPHAGRRAAGPVIPRMRRIHQPAQA